MRGEAGREARGTDPCMSRMCAIRIRGLAPVEPSDRVLWLGGCALGLLLTLWLRRHQKQVQTAWGTQQQSKTPPASKHDVEEPLRGLA